MLPSKRRLRFCSPFLLVLVLILAVDAVGAGKKDLPSQAELDAITARGRLLAEYDTASWYATDSVQALKPPTGSVGRYIAKRMENGWIVVFGRMNEKGDGFLVVYEATQGATPHEFTVKTYDPPREDTGFYLNAEKAMETVLKDFQRERRPYNMSVIPADSGQMYVYIYPGSTVNGVYLLGGDARYLISGDGATIIEKRQLHKSILEFSGGAPGKTLSGMHTHILSDITEDTDVMYVLTRKPAIPEYVITASKVIWVIGIDGSIKRGK
ncbi:MAG: hypothetical protein WB723_13125 [Candidatus Acidiferrales bacterium]